MVIQKTGINIVKKATQQAKKFWGNLKQLTHDIFQKEYVADPEGQSYIRSKTIKGRIEAWREENYVKKLWKKWDAEKGGKE